MKDKSKQASGERLLEAARVLKGAVGPSDVARLLGVSPQKITNWLSRGVSKEGMLDAQRLIGCSAVWLQTGEGEMIDASRLHVSGKQDESISEQTQRVIDKLLPAGSGNLVTWEKPEDLEPDADRVWIDRYDYRYSAGNGLIQWEVRQKKALPFDIGFFKALGVRPQDCKLAQVHGRSMEPYLFNRDMMMICTAKTRVKDGLIYAVTFEDEPLVKQIFKEPEGALRLHSYNPEYPDKIILASQLEGLHIAGEVIYRSGSGLAGGN
ncbi:S24 family peptidase [Paraburkholderia fungorum]|nr:S24 family peptidase [Paraburkholderia fungorum]